MTNPSDTFANGSFFDRYFKLSFHKTTVKQEIIAGFTTFITMVYIIFINPKILGFAGMDPQATFVTTALITAIGSILMGVVARLPIALAPGMGINAYFAYVLVGSNGLTWQTAMGLLFIGATGLFLLSLFRIRYWMVSNIPLPLRIGVSSGCGLMITLIGLHNAGIIVADPDTMVKLGDPTSIPFILGSVSILLVCVLAHYGVRAAALFSFLVVTVLALFIDKGVVFHGIVSLPPSIKPVVGQITFHNLLSISTLTIAISVMLINLFESSGTFIAVTHKANLCDENGRYPYQQQSLFVDSLSSMLGSYMGTSSVTAYLESASGVAVGGRTGLTSVTVGVLFLLSVFFSPLEKMIPLYATSGALIYIGVLMASDLARVDWSDMTDAVPAFITTVMMPFTFTITEGIATGFIAFVIMKLCCRRFRDITICSVLMAILFLIRYSVL